MSEITPSGIFAISLVVILDRYSLAIRSLPQRKLLANAIIQDDPTSAPPTTEASDPTESTSESTAAPETPSVAPATGIELVQATSAVRVPAGWEAQDALLDYAYHYLEVMSPDWARSVASELNVFTPARLREVLDAHAEIGCDEFIVIPAMRDPAMLDDLVEVVAS